MHGLGTALRRRETEGHGASWWEDKAGVTGYYCFLFPPFYLPGRSEVLVSQKPERAAGSSRLQFNPSCHSSRLSSSSQWGGHCPFFLGLLSMQTHHCTWLLTPLDITAQVLTPPDIAAQDQHCRTEQGMWLTHETKKSEVQHRI